MQPDYALILSAGLGTRMGELGKILPKVIWPIFSKSLLELQIDYCIDVGIKNIYINVHFLAGEIIKHVKTISRQDVKIIVLHEDPLLDSGGAIHNLASRDEINYRGTVLLVNGDQFLFFDNLFYSEALNHLLSTKARAVLFGISVDKSANYNQTVVRDGMLVDIQKNQKNEDYITYSGLGIVKLEGLHPVPGASKFFQTVVNYKNELTYMITPPMFEYWDFGTAELYCENIFKIATASNSLGQISNFLSKHKVNPNDSVKFVNLTLRSLDLGQEGIFQKNCIGLKGTWQNI